MLCVSQPSLITTLHTPVKVHTAPDASPTDMHDVGVVSDSCIRVVGPLSSAPGCFSIAHLDSQWTLERSRFSDTPPVFVGEACDQLRILEPSTIWIASCHPIDVDQCDGRQVRRIWIMILQTKTSADWPQHSLTQRISLSSQWCLCGTRESENNRLAIRPPKCYADTNTAPCVGSKVIASHRAVHRIGMGILLTPNV